MKVLYSWDTVGVSSMINRHLGMSRADHRGVVLMRRNVDPYGTTAYYDDDLVCSGMVEGGAKRFYVAAAEAAVFMRPDILHMCGNLRFTGLIRRLAGGCKVLTHYHGSDARDVPYEKRAKAERQSDFVAVSTPDMLECKYGMDPVWIPNPVDTELFSPRRIPDNNRGLVMMKARQSPEDTLARLRSMGWGTWSGT